MSCHVDWCIGTAILEQEVAGSSKIFDVCVPVYVVVYLRWLIVNGVPYIWSFRQSLYDSISSATYAVVNASVWTCYIPWGSCECYEGSTGYEKCFALILFQKLTGHRYIQKLLALYLIVIIRFNWYFLISVDTYLHKPNFMLKRVPVCKCLIFCSLSWKLPYGSTTHVLVHSKVGAA